MSPDVEQVVVRQEGVLSGRPTFRGTRVQAEILFENLADGYSLGEIAESFPTLDLDDLRIAILEAGRMMMDAAPRVSSGSGGDDGSNGMIVSDARLPR